MRDSQGDTTSEQTPLMKNVVGGAAEKVEAAPTEADPPVIAAHVAAGGSPFDLVEPPSWFSYSSFDTFERCPRQYAFRYLCRLPAEQPRPAMDFGSAAHGAFEAFTRERRDRLARGEPPPTRADLERCFESAWARTSLPAEADAESWRRRAEPMLDRFWAAEPADAETVGEELRFRLHIPLDPDTQVVIAGFIDRIDRLPSGAVELIDYKTGTSGPPEEATSSLQLSIYALACRDALDLGRPEWVTLYCVEEGRRFSAARTDAALDGLRDDLAARARRIRGSDFAPTPSPRSCGWCDFAALCPVSARSSPVTSGVRTEPKRRDDRERHVSAPGQLHRPVVVLATPGASARFVLRDSRDEHATHSAQQGSGVLFGEAGLEPGGSGNRAVMDARVALVDLLEDILLCGKIPNAKPSQVEDHVRESALRAVRSGQVTCPEVEVDRHAKVVDRPVVDEPGLPLTKVQTSQRFPSLAEALADDLQPLLVFG